MQAVKQLAVSFSGGLWGRREQLTSAQPAANVSALPSCMSGTRRTCCPHICPVQLLSFKLVGICILAMVQPWR